MSHFGIVDWYTEVQKGLVNGHTIVHKFGRNDGVPSGTWEPITLLGTTGWQLSANTTVRIKAGGDAGDTAAGLGAQSVKVYGASLSGTELSSTIVTAGAGASAATSESYARVYRAHVVDTGAYGAANIASVVIENSAGGTDLIQIAAGEGQTQFGAYTIPAGKTGYFLRAIMTVDGNKSADLKLCKREGMDVVAAPFTPTRVVNFWDGILGTLNFEPKTPSGALPEKTDIWFEARGGAAVTEASVDFEILLVDN